MYIWIKMQQHIDQEDTVLGMPAVSKSREKTGGRCTALRLFTGLTQALYIAATVKPAYDVLHMM